MSGKGMSLKRITAQQIYDDYIREITTLPGSPVKVLGLGDIERREDMFTCGETKSEGSSHPLFVPFIDTIQPIRSFIS